jgi:hypothetical protein
VTCSDCSFAPAVVCGILCISSTLLLRGCSLESAAFLADEQSIVTLTQCHVEREGVTLSTGCSGTITQCRFSDCQLALIVCPQSLTTEPVTLSGNTFTHNDTAISTCWSPELRIDETNVFQRNKNDKK